MRIIIYFICLSLVIYLQHKNDDLFKEEVKNEHK
jgi:hypothetical protein